MRHALYSRTTDTLRADVVSLSPTAFAVVCYIRNKDSNWIEVDYQRVSTAGLAEAIADTYVQGEGNNG